MGVGELQVGDKVVKDPNWNGGVYDFYKILYKQGDQDEDTVEITKLDCETISHKIPGTNQREIEYTVGSDQLENFELTMSDLVGVYDEFDCNKKYSLIVSSKPNDWKLESSLRSEYYGLRPKDIQVGTIILYDDSRNKYGKHYIIVYVDDVNIVVDLLKDNDVRFVSRCEAWSKDYTQSRLRFSQTDTRTLLFTNRHAKTYFKLYDYNPVSEPVKSKNEYGLKPEDLKVGMIMSFDNRCGDRFKDVRIDFIIVYVANEYIVFDSIKDDDERFVSGCEEWSQDFANKRLSRRKKGTRTCLCRKSDACAWFKLHDSYGRISIEI